MLVLTRKTKESIWINETICITIVSVDTRGTVKIGIEAPKEMPIRRSELAKKELPNATLSEVSGMQGLGNNAGT